MAKKPKLQPGKKVIARIFPKSVVRELNRVIEGKRPGKKS
jgi:hypothetical protein